MSLTGSTEHDMNEVSFPLDPLLSAFCLLDTDFQEICYGEMLLAVL